MSLLNGASGQNDNTLVYIVNALNGSVKKVNTLAEEAGRIARNAEDGVADVVIEITNVSEEFAAALSAADNAIRSELAQQWIADIQTILADGSYTTEQAVLSAISSAVEQTASSLTASFNQSLLDMDTNIRTDISSFIQQDASGILLGRSDSPVRLRITNSQIQIYNVNDDDVITYWNIEEQRTPKALSVPTGGQFSLGNFRFVPRSSGNLSLVKV